jgi:hypothetical protein
VEEEGGCVGLAGFHRRIMTGLKLVPIIAFVIG